MKYMKTTMKIVTMVVALFCATIGANAQPGVSEVTDIYATIIEPLSIDWASDMNFGNCAVNSFAGTIVLTTGSTRTGTGGATPVANPTGTVSAAEFDVFGTAGAQVFITLPSSPITVTRQAGTETMTVSDFVSLPAGNFTIATNPTTIFVGATLNVGADQEPGIYEAIGDLAVTVNYQ